MALSRTFIPYGAWWSSPFAKWQGSLADRHSMELAAETTRAFLAARKIEVGAIDSIAMGISVPQRAYFYGAPWLAGMIGAEGITGPTLSQACATSARMIASAAAEVELGINECTLLVACDRTSNGPHIYYPDPTGPGGMGSHENPVWDNFGRDPFAGGAMIGTAEAVAAEQGITRQEQDDVALMRSEQYATALADGFHERFMIPVELKKGRKVVGTLDSDEGVFPTTAEGLAALRPMLKDGTVTFGSQTHPADGNAGLVLTTAERAAELAPAGSPTVQLLGWGTGRVEKGMMPKAVVPAATDALRQAGLSIDDIAAFKTHNPFAINDVYFHRQTGVALERMNNYGCPLVWGHPQAPTGLRATIELIEELAIRGGGIGLFTGCAAGDTAMAVIVKVG